MNPRMIFILMVLSAPLFARETLDRLFANPPEESKPWCYWYWLNNNISKDGVTKDLEAMNKAGIKLAMIGNIEGGKGVRMFSPEWHEITRHALREAKRLSLEIMMFNGPGWSQSGGPWIQTGQSMRRVGWNEVQASGGVFSARIRPEQADASQDIAVLAVPRRPHVVIEGVMKNGVLRFTHDSPITARSLTVRGKGKGTLHALTDAGRVLVASIDAPGGNPRTDFLAAEAEVFGFPDVRASEFELVGSFKGPVSLGSEPKVAQFVEKQMGRMHPTPSPTWESYQFPDSVEPGDASTLIRRGENIHLTDKLAADGTLNCTLPDGQWTVIHFGMVPTGAKNGPAPPEATGLECDKMSRSHTKHHFDSMFGKLLNEVTPEEKAAWVGITIDSYEVGSQNWTDGFSAEFRKRNGYDPVALLPVMTGRMIDDAKTSDRFLWDLRRTVADMIAENYVAGLREEAHGHGLRLWCENYGHWGFPGEFTIYGGHSDEVAGEFWVGQNLGNIECRAASSTAHIYGKRRVFAEAFTSKLQLGSHPAQFKSRGEELFCEGINHFVFHVYAHQTTDGVPGKNPWFGTAFHRNTPWFHEARDWVKYLQRCHTLLQEGEPLADVAVYIGDFAPQMTGPSKPVPSGYDFDYIGSDAILRRLQVVNNEWVVFDEHDPRRIAARWKRLALPQGQHARPHVLQRIGELRNAGGQVVEGVPVSERALREAGIAPLVSDTSCPVLWKARRIAGNGMIFFLSNFKSAGTFEATLRVHGMVPELFDPVSGSVIQLVRYRSVGDATRVTLDIKDVSDCCFLVFREVPLHPSVVSTDVPPAKLELSYDAKGRLLAESQSPIDTKIQMSDGTTRSVHIPDAAELLPLGTSWKTSPTDPQGHSVLHDTTFELPADFARDRRVILDLGDVGVMARVSVNGTSHDTLWRKPYQLDVTRDLKAGENRIQVQVTSTSDRKPSLGPAILRASRKVIVE